MKSLVKYCIILCIIILHKISYGQKDFDQFENLQKIFCHEDTNPFFVLLKDVSDISMRQKNCIVLTSVQQNYAVILKKTKKQILIKEVFPIMDSVFYDINDSILKTRNYYVISKMAELLIFCIKNEVISIHCREKNRIILKWVKYDVIFDEFEKPKGVTTEICKNWYLVMN